MNETHTINARDIDAHASRDATTCHDVQTHMARTRTRKHNARTTNAINDNTSRVVVDARDVVQHDAHVTTHVDATNAITHDATLHDHDSRDDARVERDMNSCIIDDEIVDMRTISFSSNVATNDATNDNTKTPIDATTRANEIRELLRKLSIETNANAKKRIRRALRSRSYYISRVDTHVVLTHANNDKSTQRNAS